MHQEQVILPPIRENFSLIMAHAYSRASLGATIKAHFAQPSENLSRACFDLAKERADRALLEMATQLRILDKQLMITEFLKEFEIPPLGIVIQGTGKQTDLFFRDATNKILHASRFEWECADVDAPKIICHSDEPERWQRAEIFMLELAKTFDLPAFQ